MQTFRRSKKNTFWIGIKSSLKHTGRNYILPLFLSIAMLIGVPLQAQTIDQRTITISMSASELLPADLVIFNITINAEADTPQQAFEMHKEREQALVNLLHEFEILEEDISFEPVRMNKRFTNDEQSRLTQTSQNVSLTFSNFDIYEEIQLRLIEEGFDTFNGRFSSTELELGKTKAITNAIASAKEKATLIAESAGVELGRVQQINHSDYQISAPRRSADMMMRMSSESSMMEFSQTVSVTANITISYSIGK